MSCTTALTASKTSIRRRTFSRGKSTSQYNQQSRSCDLFRVREKGATGSLAGTSIASLNVSRLSSTHSTLETLCCFLTGLLQSAVAQLSAYPEIRSIFHFLDEQFKGLEREMALAPGFEQQPDGAFEGKSNLTSRFPCMLIVDEHPVRRLLLAKHNNFISPASSDSA